MEYSLQEIREGTGFASGQRFAPVEDYQGWKNYPTWNVALWLGNDEPLYRQAIALANDLGYQEDYEIADAFKNWVCDQLAPDLGASFAADLLGYALGDVDWFEVAASFKHEPATV